MQPLLIDWCKYSSAPPNASSAEELRLRLLHTLLRLISLNTRVPKVLIPRDITLWLHWLTWRVDWWWGTWSMAVVMIMMVVVVVIMVVLVMVVMMLMLVLMLLIIRNVGFLCTFCI